MIPIWNSIHLFYPSLHEAAINQYSLAKAGLGDQYKIGKGLGACEMVWQGLLNKEFFFSLYRASYRANQYRLTGVFTY